MCDTTLPDLHDDDDDDEVDTHNHGAPFIHQLGENTPAFSEMNRWKDDDPSEVQRFFFLVFFQSRIFTFGVRFYQQGVGKGGGGGQQGERRSSSDQWPVLLTPSNEKKIPFRSC